MSQRTDVCAVCEEYHDKIKTAILGEDKISFASQFADHLSQAPAEHQYYLDKCLESKSELSKNSVPNFAHYTFDFAKQLHLPHHYRQVGPMYFKVGRKVQLFGICCDNNYIQVNYLVDESETIGKNGTKSHGADLMLDHYFTTHSLQESVCYCHADNCVGQNKNRFVIGYFAWRVITGKHTQIHLSFIEVGHTRCLVDGHFGLIKKSYRRMENSVEKEISIFKIDVTAAKVCKAKLPKAILPAGLTRERQEYLYKEVEPYVKLEYQDITCPPLD